MDLSSKALKSSYLQSCRRAFMHKTDNRFGLGFRWLPYLGKDLQITMRLPGHFIMPHFSHQW
jgi:hypothetical protein